MLWCRSHSIPQNLIAVCMQNILVMICLLSCQVGPAESPKLWWQHAARAVLRERKLLAASGASCYSQARCARRRSHQRIYRRCKGPLSS